MIKLRTVSCVAVVVCALGLAMLVTACATPKYSGFLPNYSILKKEKDLLGRKRLAWFSPKATGAHYQKMLIEDLVYYPTPQPTKQVSAEVLDELRDYADATLRKRVIGGGVPVVDKAGPGVMRVRWALTAVAIKKGLRPNEYIPIGLIVAGATEAAGIRKRNVKLAIEAQFSDSLTGEVLVLAVREAKGVKVKGKAPLTLEDAKPQIDRWGEAVEQMVIKRRGIEG